MINDGLDDLILKELISEGLTGDALSVALEARKIQIRAATKAMITDATATAKGGSEFYTTATLLDNFVCHKTSNIVDNRGEILYTIIQKEYENWFWIIVCS